MLYYAIYCLISSIRSYDNPQPKVLWPRSILISLACITLVLALLMAPKEEPLRKKIANYCMSRQNVSQEDYNNWCDMFERHTDEFPQNITCEEWSSIREKVDKMFLRIVCDDVEDIVYQHFRSNGEIVFDDY